MSNNGSKAKEVTLADVMGAVRGVGDQVQVIRVKVDKLESRVDKLEQQGPQLKTRIVRSYESPAQPAPARPAPPQPAVRPDDDDGEDEAIRNGVWEKVIKTKPCNKVSLTKTRKRDAWKLLLHMPGLRRPATFIAWDGPEQAIDFFCEVVPWLSLDYFDEDGWQAQDNGQGTAPIFHQESVNFLVDWFKTAPNERGHTFVNVEAVYPLAEEA